MSTIARPTDRADAASRWRERSAPFTAEAEEVADWDAPSPCEGWTARDVLAHVINTEREFLARVDLAVEETAEAGEDPAARWATHHAAVDALLADPAVAARAHDGAFGPTTVGDVLLDFYGFDLIVHRWDLARSQGRDARLSAAELELVDTAVDGWGEHAYAPGIFGAPVDVPAEADLQTRVLAKTGRRG